MASHNFLDAISDSIGFASTVAVVVWLVTSLQPAFKRVRDSCRAGEPPEGRAQLLWTSILIVTMWMAAVLLYCHNLVSLWDIMGSLLKRQPVNRTVYALLHLYLFLLLLCGFHAYMVSILEIAWNHHVLSDLWMIARFRTSRYHLVEDTEAQHGSSVPGRIGLGNEAAGVVDVRNTNLPPNGEELRSNSQGSRGNVATTTTARTIESEHPTQEPTRSASVHPIGRFLTRAVESPLRLVDANTLQVALLK